MYRDYKVKQILDLHDGDTIYVHIDLGVDECDEIHLRLMGVFAQELKKPGGAEARQAVVDWFAVRAKHPMKVWTAMTKNNNEIQSLGRWVGDVEDVTTGEHLCVAMMAWLLEHPESAGGTGAT